MYFITHTEGDTATVNNCHNHALIFIQDYKQELVFVTEREKFVVPVRAIGARALLDFPDDVTFSSAPVKVRGSVYINPLTEVDVYTCMHGVQCTC